MTSGQRLPEQGRYRVRNRRLDRNRREPLVHRDPRDRVDTGQAAIELALSMPLVMLLLLGVVQVALIVRSQLLVDHAAREAARAASVAASPSRAARSSVAASALRSATVAVAVDKATNRVQVTVTLTDPTDVPLIGALLAEVTLQSTVTMQLEPP